MKKVIGNPSYRVDVECPECGRTFNATEDDDESYIVEAMFKNTQESCTNMDIEIYCKDCGCEFILDELVY